MLLLLLLGSLSVGYSESRLVTDELGSRLERPIHFECENEPMHIGMRLLHPAAADHIVSITRQQVQRIFSFSLRSRAVTSFIAEFNELSTGGTALQQRWFFPCRVDCTHQVSLPPVCVSGNHLPCALQHAKRAFSLKEHSRVRLFKDDVASGKLNVTPL